MSNKVKIAKPKNNGPKGSANLKGTQNEKNTRRVYLDVLRFFACFLIVMVHTSAWGISKAPAIDGTLIFSMILNGLALAGVPIFMMISGALFLNPKKEITLKQLFLKYILRLVVIYYLWNGLYVLSSLLYNGFGDKDIVMVCLKGLINGNGTYHLWFFPVIIGVYMLIPFLKKCFGEDRKLSAYFIIVFMVASVLLPFIFDIKIWGYATLKEGFSKYYLSAFTGYTGFFVLGHYLNTWKADRKKIAIAGFAATGVGVLFTVASVVITLVTKTAYLNFNDAFTPLTTAYAIGLFLLFKVGFDMEGLIFSRPMSMAAGFTLGIYIIHPYLLNLYEMYLDPKLAWPVVVKVILLSVALLWLSLWLVAIIRFIPKVGKYIT